MIYSFFHFKCTVNLNGNCRITSRKTKICPFNITFLYKPLYRITTTILKSLFLQKNLRTQTIKRSNSAQISSKFRRKKLALKQKSTLTFINRQNFFVFFFKSKFNKSKFAKTCMSLNQLLLIKLHEAVLNTMINYLC